MLLQDKRKKFIKTLNISNPSLLPKNNSILARNKEQKQIVNQKMFSVLSKKYGTKERKVDYISMEVKKYYN